MKQPKPLQKGSTIALTCPAGYMSMDKVQNCVKLLTEKGYVVKIGKTVGSNSKTYFSGTVAQRKKEFQSFLDDDKVDTILCARGGNGCGQFITELNFEKFAAKPKWIIGFSDVTVFHSHIQKNLGIHTLHAPMAAAFNNATGEVYINYLLETLSGKLLTYTFPKHSLNKYGTITKKLVGGNLALLVNSIGTASQVNFKNKILFIEDVGEYIYAVDRMMNQLQRAGILQQISGLVVGQFSDMKDTDRPFGGTVYEAIHNYVKEYNYPIAFDASIGHTEKNITLIHGKVYTLVVEKTGASLIPAP